ncbi:autolysin [Streptococcus pneumoniae]|nr:autolysin [Streptococcus pneumoniae]
MTLATGTYIQTALIQKTKINGTWYYFDGSGYMLSDRWKKHTDGNWYYFDQSGEAMVSNAFIQSADGTGWYYLKPDGSMADKPDFTVEPDGLITVK